MLENDFVTPKLNPPETILSEAFKLNSDLGCHVKNCSFSTHLTGRFYQNNSLESHKARSHRIAQMKAKRKQLERSLELEERKIHFLENKLKQRQLQRLQGEEMKKIAESAAILIQSHMRRILSVNKLKVLHVEREIINYVVRFIQSLFRGRRDRIRVHKLRDSIIRHRTEELAAIKIQSRMRQVLAKGKVGLMLEERIIQHNRAACAIQSSIRGYRDRRFVDNLKQERCAIKIQAQYRGMIGRGIRDARRKARRKKREKAQRIPLHERRYSTYSIESSTKESTVRSRKDSIAKRRFTEITSLSKIAPSSNNNERRLTGLEILRLMHSKEHQKENTEVDTNSKAACTNDYKEKCVSTQQHSKHHLSEEKSIASSSASASALALASTSALTVDEEQILLSRQRAAARAAKLKRQTQQQNQKKLKQVKDRKKELDQLEMKRRNMMKQKMVAKKENKFSKKIKENKDDIREKIINDKKVEKTNLVCELCEQDDERTNEREDSAVEGCNFVLAIDFDDNFDEEFCENEFDLDDMG